MIFIILLQQLLNTKKNIMSVIKALMRDYNQSTQISKKIEYLQTIRRNLQVSIHNLSNLHTHENNCDVDHIKNEFREHEQLIHDIVNEVVLPSGEDGRCILLVRNIQAFASVSIDEVMRQKTCLLFRQVWFSFSHE